MIEVTMLVNEQNVSVVYIEINAISQCLDDLNNLSAGRLLLLKTLPCSRACKVNSENTNISDLDDMSIVFFCQSRAVFLLEKKYTHTPCLPLFIYFTMITIFFSSVFPNFLLTCLFICSLGSQFTLLSKVIPSVISFQLV